MIRIKRFASLGHADYGWLQARYHFSFANYYDPQRMGFGKLRVVNDDMVMPGHGFDMHPHRDMEIITFIKQGELTHQDSYNHKGTVKQGQVQVMSAGRGVLHSEYNHGQEITRLYQIWIKPNKTGVKPRWEQSSFSEQPVTGHLNLLVSGNPADDALFIYQDAMIYGGNVSAGMSISQPIFHQLYLLVASGKVRISSEILVAGDAAMLTDELSLDVLAVRDAQLIAIDVPV